MELLDGFKWYEMALNGFQIMSSLFQLFLFAFSMMYGINRLINNIILLMRGSTRITNGCGAPDGLPSHLAE